MVDKNRFRCYNFFMKNLPIGIQTFEELIREGYVYVDKTKLIHDLFAKGGKYYFFSRPRRFGKSVLISTLAELFRGNKELFKGLWIYDQIEWASYPVIHIDFSLINFESPEELKKSLGKFLKDTAISFGVQLEDKIHYKESFIELIKKLSSKEKVVILIDEYDKPILEFLEKGKIETAYEIRAVLKSFYSVIKGADPFIRFVFITGVSKFSRVSIFSDLNNLNDITLSDKFSTLVGYTEPELHHYFSSYIDWLAEKLGKPSAILIEDIRRWYNGYSWDGANFVYNPFSILNLFDTGRFKNFWFSTGSPAFLIQFLKKRKKDLVDFENFQASSDVFDTYDLEDLDIVAILFQTGYLTVKKIITNPDLTETYHLSYPNLEVRSSFFSHLFRAFINIEKSESQRILDRITGAIKKGNIDLFIQEIKSLFASIPYQIFIEEKEAYYHSLIYLILKLSGAVLHGEVPTNIGRIDAVLETVNTIFIMEFKVGSADEAMKQIKQMKYVEPYLGNSKKKVLLGVGFDPEKRNIGDYLVENVENP